MALINFQQKEIVVKIVYFGPAFSGKTTNMRKLHDLIPSKLVGSMATLDTEDERTLFFDYFPIKAGAIGRYKLKLQIYSVPGQAYYRATRKMVLQNADGVIFVADSQNTEIEHNIVAFSDLEENLRSYGVDTETFPIVIQYNKRDIKSVLPTDFLDRKLNLRGYPYCEGIATEGKGVLEAFNGIVELVTRRLRTELGKSEQGQPLDGDYFQPQGVEGDDDEVLSDMVHRIADLGEHGEKDLRDALVAVDDAPPTESDMSQKSSQRLSGGPIALRLESIEQPEPDLIKLDFRTESNRAFHFMVRRPQLEALLKPHLENTPAPESSLPASKRSLATPILFLWLVFITAWMLLQA